MSKEKKSPNVTAIVVPFEPDIPSDIPSESDASTEPYRFSIRTVPGIGVFNPRAIVRTF